VAATGGFDPNAAARAASGGRRRGSRWRFVLGAVLVLAALAYAFDAWVGRLFTWHPADAGPDIVVSHEEPFVPTPAAFVPPQPAPAPPPAEAEKTAERPAAQERKLPTRIAWTDTGARPPDMPWFHDGRRPVMARGCALRPGASVIRASLLTAVESEVAGQAIAQVSEDVYDADGYGRVLVPAGTRVVGLYKAEQGLGFDRRRLDFAWTEMTLPDGRQLDLGSAQGADASGAVGVGGRVTTPWGNVIASAALLTVFDAMVTVPAAATGDDLAAAVAQSAGREAGQVGREVTRKVLGFEPRISVTAGTIVTILPTKTVQVCG
jgi:type IV secretion system protein TrbI